MDERKEFYRSMIGLMRAGKFFDDFVPEFKRELRAWQKRVSPKPLLKQRWSEDGEDLVEYGILKDDGQDCEKMIDDMWVDLPNSPYDCSGRMFSINIRCFRCGAGIAVIHRMCRDV